MKKTGTHDEVSMKLRVSGIKLRDNNYPAKNVHISVDNLVIEGAIQIFL